MRDEAQAGGTADTPQDVMTPDLWSLVWQMLPDEEAKRHFAATCRYYRMAALLCTCCNNCLGAAKQWLSRPPIAAKPCAIHDVVFVLGLTLHLAASVRCFFATLAVPHIWHTHPPVIAYATWKNCMHAEAVL